MKPASTSRCSDLFNSAASPNVKLLGTNEVDARLRLRYKGTSPKKRLASNLNYYDHNILGLDNRTVSNVGPGPSERPDAAPVFESVDTVAKRSRSQPAVNRGFSSGDRLRGARYLSS